MPNCLISIIMPVFNGEYYISEAIDSAINQTYRNWELLIINDGSNDDSEKIILSYTDERIKYYKQENKGVSAARNVGLRNMKGCYFCFLDADDVLTQQSLASRAKVLHENSHVNFVDGQVIITKVDLGDIIDIWKPNLNMINPRHELTKINDKIFVTISWMFRRKNGVNYSFQEDISHCEDLWFFIENSKTGLYSFVNEPILYFRRTDTSAMADLHGLEMGYLRLYSMLMGNKEFNIGTYGLAFTRLKMMKIMFLSYLSKGKFKRAIKTILNFTTV